MGQALHGCAMTTHAVRAAIQRSKTTVAALAEKHGVTLDFSRPGKPTDNAFISDISEASMPPYFERQLQ